MLLYGVYTNNLISYENALPNYTLASELKGRRLTSFKINTETEEKIYDKDGKEVDSIPEGANEEDYRKEQVKINPDESLTKENYKKAKKIFEGRLEELGVADYMVRLNEETGEILVELPDETNTDTMLHYLLCKGDFSMIDSEDETVLLEKSDVKKATATYGSDETGSVDVHLSIKFNKEGKKKLANVSREYIKVEENNNTVTNETSNELANETTSQSTANVQKKVTMKLEGMNLTTTYFADELDSGELTLKIGSGTDNETVYEYITQAQVYAMLLNNAEMPVEYKIEDTNYVISNIDNDSLYLAIGIVSAVAVLLIIYLILKYKTNGLLCSIAFISSIAILLLLIRYTGTTVSVGGLSAILAIIAFDAYFMNVILKDIKENPSKDNVKYITYRAYLQKIDVIIVFLIIAVVFTFMPQVQVFSIGMTLFYGFISLIISNLIFMRKMLIARQ